MNKLVAVIAVVVLLSFGFLVLTFNGLNTGSTKVGVPATSTATGMDESQVSSTSIPSGNNSGSFYMAMNVIPTIRLVPLGGSANFMVVLYNGGDLEGNYSLSASAPAGLSFDFGAAPVSIFGAGPHSGELNISSSSEMSPGTYNIMIDATGSKGTANQTFDFHVQRNLVLLSSGATPFSNITVRAGDNVTWVSLDGPVNGDAFHRIVFLNLKLTSAPLPPFASWSLTFTQPGTYRYYDDAEPSITGEVIVLP